MCVWVPMSCDACCPASAWSQNASRKVGRVPSTCASRVRGKSPLYSYCMQYLVSRSPCLQHEAAIDLFCSPPDAIVMTCSTQKALPAYSWAPLSQNTPDGLLYPSLVEAALLHGPLGMSDAWKSKGWKKTGDPVSIGLQIAGK